MSETKTKAAGGIAGLETTVGLQCPLARARRLLAQSSLRYRRQMFTSKLYFAKLGTNVLTLDDWSNGRSP